MVNGARGNQSMDLEIQFVTVQCAKEWMYQLEVKAWVYLSMFRLDGEIRGWFTSRID